MGGGGGGGLDGVEKIVNYINAYTGLENIHFPLPNMPHTP